MTEESSAKLIQQPRPPTAWSRNEFHLTMIPLKMRPIAKGLFILLSMYVDWVKLSEFNSQTSQNLS